MTPAEKESVLVMELNELDDWMFQYDYILLKSTTLASLTETDLTDENLIRNCQAKVWITVRGTPDAVKIDGHSMSMLVKGLLAMLIEILNNQPASEIFSYEIHFLDKTNLGFQLSSGRIAGLQSMLDYIKKSIKEDIYHGNEKRVRRET